MSWLLVKYLDNVPYFEMPIGIKISVHFMAGS